jgi:hypothetical protein
VGLRRKGVVASQQTRIKISQASKNRLQSEIARKKNRDSHLGEKNHGFVGHYISPTGIRYASSTLAADSERISRQTLVIWAKNNKNGWSFQPKEKFSGK